MRTVDELTDREKNPRFPAISVISSSVRMQSKIKPVPKIAQSTVLPLALEHFIELLERAGLRVKAQDGVAEGAQTAKAEVGCDGLSPHPPT